MAVTDAWLCAIIVGAVEMFLIELSRLMGSAARFKDLVSCRLTCSADEFGFRLQFGCWLHEINSRRETGFVMN